MRFTVSVRCADRRCVGQRRAFAFLWMRCLQAIHPAARRLIAIGKSQTSPDRGDGGGADAIVCDLRRPHRNAVVLVDEGLLSLLFGETVAGPDRQGCRTLVVARTFSKGVWASQVLRLGALIAVEETMQWLRRVISPYSVNQLAACMFACRAWGDRDYLDLVCGGG